MVESRVEMFLKLFEGTRNTFVSWYLGVRVEFGESQCVVSQSVYTQQMLDEYDLESVRKYSTPLNSKFYDELRETNSQDTTDCTLYRNMIGSLLYLANHTRPVISLAVGIISQYVSSPTSFLMKALHRVFGYLRETADLSIVYKKQNDLEILFYCDSDYASEKANENRGQDGLV